LNTSCFLIALFSEIYELSAEDVVFQASPLTFDPSVVEIFTTLSVGATLLTVPDTARMRPRDLAHCLAERNRVTVIQVKIVVLFKNLNN
jgi:acyl-CoA synthetase